MKAHVRVPRLLILGAQILVLLAAATAVFATSAYFAMRAAVFGSEVEVPRVLGLPVEPAREALSSLELVLETTGTRHNGLVPAGQILSQKPPPGAGLKPGRKVKVLVSLGPEQFRAPELLGMPVPRARVILSQESLRLGSVAYAHSEAESENLVVAQDPPPGAPVERAGRVDLLVSTGAREALRVMPDLVGRPLPQARRFLAGSGLRLGNVRTQPDPSWPPGIVVRQFPLSGYPVAAGDLISLVVSE